MISLMFRVIWVIIVIILILLGSLVALVFTTNHKAVKNDIKSAIRHIVKVLRLDE